MGNQCIMSSRKKSIELPVCHKLSNTTEKAHKLGRCDSYLQNLKLKGISFNWSCPKSFEDGKIQTKNVKAKVCHRENAKF